MRPVSDQINGGWSNRKKTFTVGGALTAAASLVTIVSFLTGPAGPPPTPTPTSSPTYQVTPIPTFSPTGSGSPAGTAYPASAQNSIIGYCEQNLGEPLSYCQCDLSWLKANIPYSLFVTNPTTFVQEADAYASC